MLPRFLTFKDYLRIIHEDAAEDADQIRADIAVIDATMATRNKPLVQKKTQLTKILAVKEKQAAAEQKTQPQDGEMNATQTPTPGSSGGGTPGTIDQR